MTNIIDIERETLRAQLLGSFLEFQKTFYKILTGRDYIVSNPLSRESHNVTVSRALTRAFNLQALNHRLIINIPPGHGKSTMLAMWVAWAMAHYPDSNFLYISYSKELATKHTETIRAIMSLRHYIYLFGVKLRNDSQAKHLFKTLEGGTVGAYGSSGSITGQDAGLPNLDRFSGAIIYDDAHKPDDVHSDTVRKETIANYSRTIQQRARGVNVPTIFIGQRLHEDDLPAHLLAKKDGYEWEQIVLKAIDDAGNALYPESFPLEDLLIRKETDIYVFASQMQQDPQPAGGALFRPEWFVELDNEPDILMTFITADTAETAETYNDATVFSFWGLYKLNTAVRDTPILCLHWIDCVKIRVEPKDLESEFLVFYDDCMRYKVQPLFAAIEKKSTGVTLISIFDKLRGLDIRDIKRTRASGSKTSRFLEMQREIAARKISFSRAAKHKDMCVSEARKITANNTHAHDDITDTLYDAVKIALIDKLLYIDTETEEARNDMLAEFSAASKYNQHMRAKQWQ